MHSTYEIPAGGPRAGQQYLDTQGRRWRVQQVSTLGSRDSGGYSVLHVSIEGPDRRGASFRLTSKEFFSLAAVGGLKAVRS